MKFSAVAAASVAAFAAAPVQAWWDNGHMLVGEIATQLMAPADVKSIENALAAWKNDFPNTHYIKTAAIWPDLIKCKTQAPYCNTTETPSFSTMDKWHYVDLPVNANGTLWGGVEPDLTLFAKSFGGDAGDVIDTFIKTFNTSQSLWTINLALRQLIHIVGDIHQPLHAVAGVNDNLPGGDDGGNLFTFAAPCGNANLHALYDSAGNGLLNNWAPKYMLFSELKANASELIKTLPTIEDSIDFSPIKDLSYAEFSQAFINGKYFKKIVLDSYSIARTQIYPPLDLSIVAGTKNVQCPSGEYFAAATALAKKRIALAGKRLSVLLTQIAKHFRAQKITC